MPTEAPDLAPLVVQAWRVHDRIGLGLLAAIPDAGLQAVPAGSKGRTVARVFAHLVRVRRGWLHYHETGQRPKIPREDRDRPPSRAALREALQESGRDVADFLDRALHGRARVRAFAGNPARWMTYLISHESHHRGQIALALKQQGMRLPEKVAMQGLWGAWMWGK